VACGVWRVACGFLVARRDHVEEVINMNNEKKNSEPAFLFFEEASDNELRCASGGLRGDGSTRSKRHKRRKLPPPPTESPGIHLPANYWRKYGPEYERTSPFKVWDSQPDENGVEQGGLGIA